MIPVGPFQVRISWDPEHRKEKPFEREDGMEGVDGQDCRARDISGGQTAWDSFLTFKIREDLEGREELCICVLFCSLLFL